MNTVIEIVGVVTGLLYLFLLMKENISCWLFGIISSLCGIFLFIVARLYSEAILYTYYVFMGIYGWIHWYRGGSDTAKLPISEWKPVVHGLIIISGSFLAYTFGYFWTKYTDAAKPLIDAFTSVFSFIATYMEARKVLSGWIYWIVINAVSTWLYYNRGIKIYAVLMAVYTILSVYGWIGWRKKYRAQSASDP